jgi:hypothetical protein
MDLSKIARGKPVPGARALAVYILEDERKEDVIRALPRAEWGFQILAGQLTGYSGWIDAVLVERAKAGGRTRRGRGAHRIDDTAPNADGDS